MGSESGVGIRSLAGQMFVVHEVKRVERPVTILWTLPQEVAVCCLCRLLVTVKDTYLSNLFLNQYSPIRKIISV